jgi:TonB family protein
VVTRFQRRRWREGPRLAAASILALLAHIAFIGIFILLSFIEVNLPGRPPKRHAPNPVVLRGLSAQQWAKNRGQSKLSTSDESEAVVAQRPKPPPEQRKPEERPKGQVVDVAPGNGQEAPDAKYLAESSNRTEKEQRSRDQTAFYRNAMPRRTSSTPQQVPGRDNVEKPVIAGNNGLANDDRPLRDAKRKSIFEVPDVKRRQEVAMREKSGDGPGAEVANRSETAEVVGNSNRLHIQRGDGASGEEESSAGKKGVPGIANLIPSMSVLDKISGAAPNDHLADVEEGDGTFLNTKEWKYSTFFNRVKQGVGMHWDPGTQIRQRDPTGNIYGGRDRYTILNVTLTDRGTVKNIYVEKSCGLDFLDLEAIAAFERAQPFPNPPPGLISADSTVRFSFGFFLEMGGGPRMRLFRGAN